MKCVAILFTLLLSFCLNAQNDSITKLFQKLKQSVSNTDKARTYISLSNAYLNKNIDSSRKFFNSAKLLFPPTKIYQTEKENLLKTKLLLLEGDILVKAGKLTDGQKIYYDLLTQYEHLLTITEKAYCLVQMGVINDYLSNAVAGIKYYNKAKRIYDSINDKKGTSECLNNMAAIFYKQGEIDKAIEYFENALDLRRNISTKSELADIIENLGTMCLAKRNFELAHKYYKEGLEYYTADNNLWGISYALKNFAKYNIKIKNYDQALDFCKQILDKYTQPNDSSGLAMINSVKSEALYLKGDYKKSIEYGQLAYDIAISMDVASTVRESARVLHDAYAADGDFKGAYKFYGIYVLMRDSLANNQTEKATLQQRLENEKEADRISHEKDMLFAESEAKRKNLILIFGGAGLIVILFFSGLLLKKFKETKKQKKIIEEQKLEVEHKQKEIVDSINYAKRIQQAQLPTQKYIQKSLNKLKK